MKNSRFGIAIVFTLLLATLTVSCNNTPAEDKTNTTSPEISDVKTDVSSSDIIDTEIGNEPADEVMNNENADPDNSNSNTPVKEPEKEIIINKLTGLEISEDLSNQRPVAIMFNNIKQALPQVGISNVDVLYEITTEGSITRLMGVATDWASLPTIGSVRSSRDYFIDISDAHNAIYVHAGGSDYAYSELWARKTERIDGTNGTRASGAAFYRDPERMKSMALEHTLVTNGEKLAKAIKENGFSTQYKDGFDVPFKFSKDDLSIEGVSASYVYIPFSYYAQSYLDYEANSKTYLKGQYLGTPSSLDMHDSPHIDGNTGEQLRFKNIIILHAPHSNIAGDTKGRIKVDITGIGTGYYITNGITKKITWKKESRTSSYKLYDGAEYNTNTSQELIINPGKTYVAIVPTTAEVVFK